MKNRIQTEECVLCRSVAEVYHATLSANKRIHACEESLKRNEVATCKQNNEAHMSVLGHLKNVVLEYIELLDVRLAPLTDLCTHHCRKTENTAQV